MGAKRTNTNFHPFASLRRVLNQSQAVFAKEIGASLSLIGKIEIFSRPVPREISNLVLKTYGAWIPPGTYEDEDHAPFPIEGNQIPLPLFALERQSFLFASNYEDWRQLVIELGANDEPEHEDSRFERELHPSFGKIIIPSHLTPTTFGPKSPAQVLESTEGLNLDTALRSGNVSFDKPTTVREILVRTLRLWLQLNRMQHHAGNGEEGGYLKYEKIGEEIWESLFKSHLGSEIRAEFEQFGKSIPNYFPGINIDSPDNGIKLLETLINENDSALRMFLDEAVGGWCTGYSFIRGFRALQRMFEDGDIVGSGW